MLLKITMNLIPQLNIVLDARSKFSLRIGRKKNTQLSSLVRLHQIYFAFKYPYVPNGFAVVSGLVLLEMCHRINYYRNKDLKFFPNRY